MNKYIKRNNNNRKKRIVYTSIFWENKTILFVCINAVELNENWNIIVLFKTFEDVSFNRNNLFGMFKFYSRFQLWIWQFFP